MTDKEQLEWDIACDLLQILRDESPLTAIDDLQDGLSKLYFKTCLADARTREIAEKKLLSKTERD